MVFALCIGSKRISFISFVASVGEMPVTGLAERTIEGPNRLRHAFSLFHPGNFLAHTGDGASR